MSVASPPRGVGDLLRDWRQRRRLSQLELAVEAEVSTRHLSFVETGRSRPSRELVVHLAEHLEVPLRDRNRLLLAKLQGVPAERRGARFTSAVAVARGEDVLFQTVASVEGRIAEAPCGPNGFGYDPLFFYPPFGRTFGEVAPQEKALVSHRGQAFARLREFLTGLAV